MNRKTLRFDLDRELQAAEKFLNGNQEEYKKTAEVNPEKKVAKINRVDPDLLRYKKQLKSFGFPEIGNFYFKKDEFEEKENTFRFFDFILLQKSKENEERMNLKKQADYFQDKMSQLHEVNSWQEKEISNLSEEIKKLTKEKNSIANRVKREKEAYEKQNLELKSSKVKISNKLNMLQIEKKSQEEKFNKLTENYQKLINKNIKPNNHIDMQETLKKNDTIKILRKVKGTEKLIESFKNGYNESLRELLFEISALKNFLDDLNRDLQKIICKYVSVECCPKLDQNLLSMSFLDISNKVKFVFQKNLSLLNELISDKNNTKNSFIDDKSLQYDMTFLEENNKANSEAQENKADFQPIYQNEDKEDNSDILNDEEIDELEFLKKKWAKTLMNVKDESIKESNE